MKKALQLISIIKLIPVGIFALISIALIAMGILNGKVMTLIITILFGVAYIGNYIITKKTIKGLKNKEALSWKRAVASSVCALLGLILFILLCIVEGTGLYYLATGINALIVGISIFEMIAAKKDKSKKMDNPTFESTAPDLSKLVEFKELLDMGAITQEEYDEKKKQLLNK